VNSTSEDVVIRAAYHALMRRYHPDADPSSDASRRAQAINAAYAVLSDPESRARYDGTRAAQGLIKLDPPHRAGRGRRRILGPAAFLGFGAVAATGTMIATIPPAQPIRVEGWATCPLGTGWADRAVCSSEGLAALHRQHRLLYAQSWDKADEVRRALLLDSGERFRDRRDACRSETCLTSTYVERLREISDIMARRVQQ
jgi:hypothetical protein